MTVHTKRVYEPASPDDGYRVLIDRLWPRGISKQRAAIDEWARELAPSDELRRWFGHRPGRFDTFKHRYIDELRDKGEQLATLRRRARDGTVTVVYAARDGEHSNAAVLAPILQRGFPKS